MLPNSPRLTYKFVSEEHLHDMFELDSDPEVMKFLRKTLKTLDEAKEKLHRYTHHQRSIPGLGAFAVYGKDTEEFLGFGFLVNIELNPAYQIEVGYRLKKKVWGQGFASEITRSLLDYGFNHLKLEEIYGTTDPMHVVSQHVLMKMGLEPLGDSPFHQGSKIFRIKNPNCGNLNSHLGDYEVHDSGKGFVSIRQISSGEIMHSVTPPEQEAHGLYVAPAKIFERNEPELVVWDVGLGAAWNAMALINELTVRNSQRPVRLISFENDLDSLRLALKNSATFSHIHHPGPKAILNDGKWLSSDHKINWTLNEGNFLEKFENAECPHIIFYDLYSIRSNSHFWTPELFQRLYAHCKARPMQFITYSASTTVRSNLLAQGFFVGYGEAMGPKSSTTVAYNDLALAKQMQYRPLDQEWLKRWARSEVRNPDQDIFNHPQFIY